MIENAMHHINGVAAFGIISITLFFLFFSGVLIWASRLKASYLDSMQELPLHGDRPDDSPLETNGAQNTQHLPQL